MKTRLLLLLAVPAVLLSLTALLGATRHATNDAQEDEGAAIEKSARAFIEAFDKGDANALATFWTPDGDYTDETGRHLKGREAIEKAFKSFFAENQGAKLRIEST